MKTISFSVSASCVFNTRRDCPEPVSSRLPVIFTIPLKSVEPETLRSPLVLRPPPAKTSPDDEINDGVLILPETLRSPLVLKLVP